jgi:hypothetical protein
MELKSFTPTALKGDLAFVASLVAVFGWSIPTSISIAIVCSGALIFIVLNGVEKFAEAHIHIGTKLAATLAKGLAEIKSLLPDVQVALASIPGQVAAEVRKEIETIEKGPAKTETEKSSSKASK